MTLPTHLTDWVNAFNTHAHLLIIKDKQQMLPLLGLTFLAAGFEVLCSMAEYNALGQTPDGAYFTYILLGFSAVLLAGYMILLHMTPKRGLVRNLLYSLFPTGILAMSAFMILQYHDTMIWYALPILVTMAHLYHLEERGKWMTTIAVGTAFIFLATWMPSHSSPLNEQIIHDNLLCQMSFATLMSLAFWYLVINIKRYDKRICDLQTALDDERNSANKDPLTGAHNRRRFDVELEREMARMQRAGNPLSFAIFDIDHFKKVNDLYGHQAGDEVLVRLSSLVQENLRAYDVWARYGGEEFALILPNTHCLDALTMLDRLRALVEHELFLKDKTPMKLTVSIGVTQYDPDRHTREQFIKEADAALYEAKHHGRNQVRACGLGNFSQQVLEQRNNRIPEKLPLWAAAKLDKPTGLTTLDDVLTEAPQAPTTRDA